MTSRIVQLEDYTRLEQTVDHAEAQWGTDFDDKNTLNDWVAYVGIYTARAIEVANKDKTKLQYDALIKAAGLALTAAARVRRTMVPGRHYDN